MLLSMSQSHEVYCPNCKGGNPPAAIRCMWCGHALQGHSPPIQTERPVTVNVSQGRPPWLLIVPALMLCGVGGICFTLWATGFFG